MTIKSQIPNTLTLANLACGFLAILLALNGQMPLAFVMILLGGLFDLMDGLSARLLNAQGPLGAQLDSLSDLVTFGAAPAVMVFVWMTTATEFSLEMDRVIDLKGSHDKFIEYMNDLWSHVDQQNAHVEIPSDNSVLGSELNGSNVIVSHHYHYKSFQSIFADLYHFALGINLKIFAVVILPLCAGAIRLAKFNISDNQSSEFKGLAIPAGGICLASLPIVLNQFYVNGRFDLVEIMMNKYLITAIVLLISGLMVSNMAMFSFKMKQFSVKEYPFQFALIACIVLAIMTGLLIKNVWISIPIIVVLYILLSLVKNLQKR